MQKTFVALVVFCLVGTGAGVFISCQLPENFQGEAAVSLYSKVPEGAQFNARYFFDGLEVTLRRQAELDQLEERRTYIYAVQRPYLDALTLLLRVRGPNADLVHDHIALLEKMIRWELENRIDSGGMEIVVTPRWSVDIHAVRPKLLVFAVYGAMSGLLLYSLVQRALLGVRGTKN